MNVPRDKRWSWDGAGTIPLVSNDEDYLEMVLKKTCWLATIYPIRVGALIGTQDSVNLDEFSPVRLSSWRDFPDTG